MRQPDHGQRFGSTSAWRARVLAADVERQPHVVERRQRREQVVGLEDEADVIAPKLGQALGVGARRSNGRRRSTLPSVGVSMQPRIDSSVVLPLPEGPISSVSSPPRNDRFTPLSACTCPAPSPRTLTDVDRLRCTGIGHRVNTMAGSMRVTLTMAAIAETDAHRRRSAANSPTRQPRRDDDRQRGCRRSTARRSSPIADGKAKADHRARSAPGK